MTVWDSASAGTTRSQFCELDVIPWMRRITGPLPARRKRTRWP